MILFRGFGLSTFLKQTQALRILLSSMLAMASLGVIYVWSVFVLPMEQEFGWNRNEISLVFTLSMLFVSVGVLSGGFLNRRMRVKRVALLAAAVILFSLVAASYSQSLISMLVFYGFLASLFFGIIYNTAVYICNLWFDKASASVSGLLQTCLGLNTIFLSIVAAELLKIYDWRLVFRLMGVMLLVSLLTFFYFVKEPSADSSSNDEVKPQAYGVNWRMMLASREFWLLWLLRLIVIAGSLGVIGHAVPMTLDLGVSYDNAVLALGLLSLTNALSRVVCGLGWDYLGFRKTMLISVTAFISSFLLLAFTYNFPSTVLTIIACCLNGFAYGSIVLVGASFTREFFGMKYFSENYGITSTPAVPAAFVGPYLMSVIKVGTQSYYYSFFILTGLGLIGLVCVLLIRAPSRVIHSQ